MNKPVVSTPDKFWVRSRLAADVFCDRFAALAERSNRFSGIGRELFDVAPPFERLFLTCDQPASDRVAEISSEPRHPHIFDFRVSDERWLDDPPTREAYGELLQEIFQPLIRAYNRTFRSSLKLQVGELPSERKRLPRRTDYLFGRFCNRSRHHHTWHIDWPTFYPFAWHCHARRVRLNRADVKALCERAGFPEVAAQEIAAAYGHCRQVLALRYGPGTYSRFFREGL
jgi:hypothetical protein